MKKIFAMLVALAALGLIVSGCQKKEEGAEGEKTTTEEPKK